MKPEERVDANAIFFAAAQRAHENGVSMAGQLTPEETWALYKAGEIELIDTRTLAERDLVGYVPGSIPIEWYDYPQKRANEHFFDELQAKVELDRPVAFLCRSGVRSHQAALLATTRGYVAAFNVLDGFEGDRNANGQRVQAGWRVRGLPWRQD